MLTLQDMVELGSVSQQGADLLAGIGAAGHSFVVYAPPRNAGKSTLTQAILAAAPPHVVRREFFGSAEEMEAAAAAPERGYLVVAEIGHRGRRGYLAGEEVGRVFRLVAAGWALASSLHAGSVEQVFDVLGRNGIDPAAAASIRYLVQVRPLGDPELPGTRRVVQDVHEVTGVAGGAPVATLLYRWEGEG